MVAPRNWYQTPPFSMLDEMTRELRRFIGNAAEGFNHYVQSWPRLSLEANDDECTLRAEVPGVAREDIDLSVDGKLLTLTGKRLAPGQIEASTDDSVSTDDAGNPDVLLQESVHGEFHRVLELPWEVDASGIKATCRDGMLEVHLPRKEASRPRQIPVGGDPSPTSLKITPNRNKSRTGKTHAM